MSAYNICFHGEIRKMICGYPLLSTALIYSFSPCSGYWAFSFSSYDKFLSYKKKNGKKKKKKIMLNR